MEPNILHIKLKRTTWKNPSRSAVPVNIINQKDYFINIPITRTYKKFGDYINVEKDPFRTTIDRQSFNPYFIELSFFESIKAISNTGNTMITITNSNENIEEKSSLYSIIINK